MSNENKILDEETQTTLVYLMSQLALKTVHNQKIEKKAFELKVDIPLEMIEVCKILAKQTNQELESLLATLASRGLELSLQIDMKVVEQTKQGKLSAPQDESSGLDFSPLKNAMSQFSEIANKLQGLQSKLSEISPEEQDVESNQGNSK